MNLRTASERRRDRLEATIGIVMIVGALVLGAIFVLSRTTDLFTVQPTATPSPVPTETEAPNARPLPLVAVTFTTPVSIGDTFLVEIATDPGTHCQITASVFSLALGNYQNVVLADDTTDSSGVCSGALPIDSTLSTGEQHVTINLRNAGRSNQARWAFEIAP